MSIKEISEKSDLNTQIAESLYWHSIWLRNADENTQIDFFRLLNDKEYRTKNETKRHREKD